MHTVLYASFGYLFLLLVVRTLSRRPGAQMAPFEFVIIFLIGGVLILSTVSQDHSVTNSTCAVIAVGFMHRTISFLKARFPRFGAIVDGVPVVLLKEGQWQEDAVRGTRVNDVDVMAAARTKGIKRLDQIKYAILERNGAISIIKKEE